MKDARRFVITFLYKNATVVTPLKVVLGNIPVPNDEQFTNLKDFLNPCQRKLINLVTKATVGRESY